MKREKQGRKTKRSGEYRMSQMNELEKLKQQRREERPKEIPEDTVDDNIKRFVNAHHDLIALLAMHDKG